MTETQRAAMQQALEALEYGQHSLKQISEHQWESRGQLAMDALRAALAEPEQRPISAVTEAVTKTVIEIEKMLCEKLGRRWQPSGMSIQTLVDELAALAEPKCKRRTVKESLTDDGWKRTREYCS